MKVLVVLVLLDADFMEISYSDTSLNRYVKVRKECFLKINLIIKIIEKRKCPLKGEALKKTSHILTERQGKSY